MKAHTKPAALLPTMVAALGLAGALLACSSGSDPVVPDPPVAPASPPLVTPSGQANGSPVLQTIPATGGVVSAAGIEVSVPPGALADAGVTLQPITDTLNGNGQSIAISSSAPWSKYLTVSFPIGPDESFPLGLSIAVQQADGSWRALYPVRVDLASRKVSAGLPFNTDVAASAAAGRAQVLASGPVAAGPAVKRVARFWAFKLTPDNPRLEVNQGIDFTPTAQVADKLDPSCQLPGNLPTLPADLNPMTGCWRAVGRPQPFANQLAGYKRQWTVTSSDGSTDALGTLVPTGNVGARYTAPGRVAGGRFLHVRFTSERDPNPTTLETALPETVVRVYRNVPRAYSGSVSVQGQDTTGNTVSAQGELVLRHQSPLVGQTESELVTYEAVESMLVTAKYTECEPVTALVPMTMSVSQLIEAGTGLGDANTYSLAMTPNEVVQKQTVCTVGGVSQVVEVPVVFAFSTSCDRDTVAYTEPLVASNRMEGSKSLVCLDGTSVSGNWTFVGQ